MIKALNYLSLLILLLSSSCKTDKSISGFYSKVGKDYIVSLEIKKDHRFILKEEAFEVNSVNQGNWYHLSKDTILLRLDTTSVFVTLQNSYRSERRPKVIILNNQELKIDNVIVNKVERH
jgi:hypothetical protein